jgi:hypothetical protein
VTADQTQQGALRACAEQFKLKLGHEGVPEKKTEGSTKAYPNLDANRALYTKGASKDVMPSGLPYV